MSGWISVKDGMPKEHDSVFKRFKGTLYWVEQMFESIVFGGMNNGAVKKNP